jgi:hypothetical protein
MRLKHTPIAVLTAISLAGSASAATLLLSDNFNTQSEDWSEFNNNLNTDQAGTLKPVTYTLSNNGDTSSWSMQHGNPTRNNEMLLVGTVGDKYASLDHNFATNANNLDAPLEIKFNIWVDGNDGGGNWASIALSASQNLFVNNGGNKFSSLFRDSGGTQQFASAATVGDGVFTFADGDQITLLLSDNAGTGSAFDGNGSVAKMYVNNVLKATYTGLGLGASDGYISFQAYGANGHYDNLTITAIPEPRAALLGGLGLLALLRRRRA